ncbi:MAG: dihydroorotase [Deltaproteobacteria bacterium]|nr:dihydroorotase [Deltaproteobacteria bacterium]
MERLIINGGHVIDPASGIDGLYNIYIMSGRIASVKPAESDTTEAGRGVEAIDASGLLVVPGFIDAHAHLRDPGYEYKETIQTGAEAAVAGGYTTVFCMANTMPVNDTASVTRYILDRATGAPVDVLPVGAISMGQKGERLTEMWELKDAGCVAISDDGRPVENISLMRKALEYSKTIGIPVISHAEDLTLAQGGVMNEGFVSTRLGLKGIPNAAEDVMAARDIMLAELTGGRLHIAHVSTKGAVELIREAKKKGIRVSAEATPHHLTLTDEAVEGYNTNAKMNPPLRDLSDVEALIAGLKDSTIDMIATDHAPQSVIEKDLEFDKAANGVLGLETAFSACHTLVEKGFITLNDLITRMTSGPANAFGLDKGTLKVGSAADIAIIDLNRQWTVEQSRLKSKSKNTAFAGRTFKAKVVKTLKDGKIVFSES